MLFVKTFTGVLTSIFLIVSSFTTIIHGTDCNTSNSITSSSFNAAFEELYAIKGDVTSKLQYLLDNPSVTKIVFKQKQKARLIVNGNIIIPENKVLAFDGSVILSGTGTLAGGVITAPMNVHIFDTSISLHNIKVKGNFFSACWYGVIADEKTFNDAALRKSFLSAPAGIAVLIPSGELLIRETLDITHSLTGDTLSTIKLDPDLQVPGTVMIRIKAGDISIKDVNFDGSNKALWIMEVTNNQPNVEIANCTISGAEQIPDTKTYAVGIRFREGMDGLHIHDCRFNNINASITGAARGIIGSGKISPRNVIIEHNTFDGITNIGAKNWDADQIVIQDYKDTSDMIIRYNRHYNISKRGEKLQCAGLTSYKNEFWSSRYKTENKRSYSAISAYNNNISITENIIHEGVFENGIEVGVITGTSFNNISIQKNKLLLSASTLGNNDGIRIFGKQITHLNISDNYIENVRKGIWLDCGSTGSIIENNEVKNSLDNAYCVNGGSNSWPDTWNNDISIINNKATDIKAYNAFDLSKISGGNISGNSAENSQSAMNTKTLDSLTGKIIMLDNKGQGSINAGSSKERPLIKNPAACIGLQYYNTDSRKKEIWNGKTWSTEE